MTTKRQKFNAHEKAKIALAALKGDLTQSQITSKYGVHATQIAAWKKKLKESLPEVFSDQRARKKTDQDELIKKLYQQIGQLVVERDWLKKKSELFD